MGEVLKVCTPLRSSAKLRGHVNSGPMQLHRNTLKTSLFLYKDVKSLTMEYDGETSLSLNNTPFPFFLFKHFTILV